MTSYPALDLDKEGLMQALCDMRAPKRELDFYIYALPTLGALEIRTKQCGYVKIDAVTIGNKEFWADTVPHYTFSLDQVYQFKRPDVVCTLADHLDDHDPNALPFYADAAPQDYFEYDNGDDLVVQCVGRTRTGTLLAALIGVQV